MQKEKINRKNKGITLVALVLTIIVMLILVGVTISISLNGGLFSTSKEASSQMQIEAEKEELLTVALGAMGRDGKIDLEKLDSNLPEGFEKTGEGTYKSSTGNTYIVTEDGEVNLLGEGEEEPEIPVTPTITLNTTQISKEITHGTAEDVEITATLNNVSGDLTWETSDSSIAEISGEGTTRTITLKKAGTAIITVSYGTASDTCTITVTEKETTISTVNICDSSMISYVMLTIQYERGMTWGDWYESSYNDGSITKDSDGDYYLTNEGGMASPAAGELVTDETLIENSDRYLAGGNSKSAKTWYIYID